METVRRTRAKAREYVLTPAFVPCCFGIRRTLLSLATNRPLDLLFQDFQPRIARMTRMGRSHAPGTAHAAPVRLFRVIRAPVRRGANAPYEPWAAKRDLEAYNRRNIDGPVARCIPELDLGAGPLYP